MALAVERESAAGQRARAKRQHIGTRRAFVQPFEIAREHLKIRQQVMRPQHRLRAAQMRVAGNHRVRIFARQPSSSSSRLAQAARSSRRIRARSHSRVSSETCSLRLRPVWILSASAPTFSFSLRMTNVWTSSSSAPSKVLRVRRFLADLRRTPQRACAASSAVRMPTRASARANACEPRHRRQAALCRNAASPKTARRLPKVPFRTGRPRVS